MLLKSVTLVPQRGRIKNGKLMHDGLKEIS
jgi:hypothetical protein